MNGRRRSSFPDQAFGQVTATFILGGLVLLGLGAVMTGESLIPYLESRMRSIPAPPLPTFPPQSTPAAPVQPTTTPAPEPTEVLLPEFDWTPLPPTIDDSVPLLPTPTPSLELAFYPPTRIVITSVGIDADVLPIGWELAEIDGTVQPIWDVPEAHRVGWHEGSAALNVAGNTVLNGHNWPQNAVFRDLYRVQPGDHLIVYSGREPFFYQIDEVLVLPEAGQPLDVRQANARYIQPTDDERVTLVTCHPYGSLQNRLIVIAYPLPSDELGDPDP